MAYEIKNGQLVAKDTAGDTRRFSKNAIDIIIGECKRRGVTNKYIIAGILATVSKESGFVPQNEGLNYSEEGLLKNFGKYFKNGRANTRDYAKKPEKIANYIYGGEFGSDGKYRLGRGGNNNPGDGWKYRGRGFNQITFKSGYEAKQKYIPGLVNNPELLNNERDAAIACVAFYVDGDFNSKKRIKSKFGVDSVNDFNNWDQALMCVINMTAGFGNSTSSDVVQTNYKKGKLCHKFLIEYLEANPQGTTAPPENPSTSPDQGADNQAQQDQQNQQDQQASGGSNQNDTGTGGGDSGTSANNGQPITVLTQSFKPSYKPTDIKLNVDEYGENDKKKISEQTGTQPFVYYNGVQISYRDVQAFKLYHRGILPSVEITMLDSYGILREDGFPHDDTLVTVYISSRSDNLRSIHMDFKIIDFKDLGNNMYSLVGLCHTPELFLRKFVSYKGKTSHETLQEVARQCQLGFCSNISNSDDKMTYINTGFKNTEFIEQVINNSYVSENSYQYVYIDYFYNLCYVDLEKELKRDNKNDKQVVSFGWRYINSEKDDKDKDEEVQDLFLSNDKGLKNSISYFEEFEIINKSTKVSLEKAYRTKTKYYDSIKKEILIFDVESETSDGTKSIILKGAVNDDKSFKDNTTSVYLGKFDIYDDGQGNVHKNFNYSLSLNRQNLDDLTKVSCILRMPSPNYNLYVYQKTPIYFSPQKKTPTIKNDFYKRISGEDWLIVDIEFDTMNGKYTQIVKAIKRELSLLPEEADFAAKQQQEKQSGGSGSSNNSGNNTNELAPGDTPAPEPTPNQPIQNNQPPPPSKVTPELQSKYKLDYILDTESILDNNGKSHRLVLIDSQPVDEVVAVAYLQMKDAAKKDGINLSLTSGFRPAFGPNFKGKTESGKKVTFTTQESLRRDRSRWKCKSKYSDDDHIFKAGSSCYEPATAAPGKSQHGNGIAIDLNTGSRKSPAKIGKLNPENYKWLVKNSWKFGFIRTVSSEEWHYEYLPTPAKSGPYAKVKDSASNGFYADLGLNGIQVA
jgi:predicted chitinase/LAS superfamily LD-carboxypeptidase LdcB